jgi:competence protein ComFB
MKQVGAHQRPTISPDGKINYPDPPMYNFPIIKGKVIDGKTFAPYSGSDISLKMSGEIVIMNGSRWSNPVPLIDETEGSFLFWPFPVKAESADESRIFSFQIELNAEGFKPVKHFINFELTADDQFVNSMEVNRIFNVEPIYLFGLNEPEEIIPGK